MHMTVSGVRSSSKEVMSGVSQGSVPGPLLFLLNVNYLPHSIQSNCKILADDLKIYLKYSALSPYYLALSTSSCENDTDNISRIAHS